MKQDFNHVSFETTQSLMREASWDPQTHELADWRHVQSHVIRFMNVLQQGGVQPSRQVRLLEETCRTVSEYLNGRYPSSSGTEMTADKIEGILRENLSPHYRLPAKLGVVPS